MSYFTDILAVKTEENIIYLYNYVTNLKYKKQLGSFFEGISTLRIST